MILTIRFFLKLDAWIMAALAWATSTKAAFYALNVLVFAAVIINPPASIQGWLLVVVSEYYQGVALPGLGSASKRAEGVTREEGKVTRQLLQETHDAALKEFAELKEMHLAQAYEQAELKKLATETHAMHKEIHEQNAALLKILGRLLGEEE
ncbi:hypothetical protein LLE49_19600 [Alicyclobacillus tolerans]|uniref:hypothetical protein n=1 Tax=Alicyclobacillus tolerans TaxID=90970 RepID=UPI001F24E124|nr:hypothetical protein [Alicyclobacillus tolerans]MCF8566928.1 hypothetical protein [Alicyclobacillus tolerans]